MWIQVEHRLHFRYDDFVHESSLELRVEPRTTEHQTLHAFRLAVGPPSRVRRYRDWHGNFVHYFRIGDHHDRIEVTARSLVSTHPASLEGLAAPTMPLPRGDLGGLLDYLAFEGPVRRSEALEGLAATLEAPTGRPIGEQVAAIGRLLLQRFRYSPGVTDYRSTTDHILESGAGVCQDFAQLMIGLLRLRGIPSRYVSGYLHLGESGPAQSHGWVEIHTPGLGWWGYDPTHECVPDERYVLVAWGRSYADVPPNRGIFRGRAAEVMHAQVETLETEPRDAGELQEELTSLDVPVFRELPSRLRGHLAEAPLVQQQQQQQSPR